MDSQVIVSLFSLFGTLLGTFAGIVTSSKLTIFRIEQLEKKVEKHNSVVERTIKIESDIKSIWARIDDVKDDIKEIEHVKASD